MEKSIVPLNRQLGSIKTKYQRLVKFIDSVELEKGNKLELELKLDNLIKVRNECDQLRINYYELPEEIDITEKESDLDTIDESLDELEVRFKTLLSSYKVSDKIETDNRRVEVKLPDIPLPEFNGNYENWEIFKSKFNSLIANNKNLNDMQKLHYLQASLKGEAKQLQTPNDTYESLFEALKLRFENKRLIASTHINAILSANKINSESSKDLRNLIDNVIKHLRALDLLDLKLDRLSQQVFLNLILSKLDQETRKQYEMTLSSTEFPDWDEFVAFIVKRCQILENINSSSKAKPRNLVQYKAQSFLSKIDSIDCDLCKLPHNLYKCKRFNDMTVEERYSHVKQNNLCLNCLSSSHKIAVCKSARNCSICHKRHNSLLCKRSNPSLSDPTKEGEKNLSPLNVHSPCFEPQVPKASGSNYLTSNAGPKNIHENHAESHGDFIGYCKEGSSTVLSTVFVYCRSEESGKYFQFRTLLDSGSQCNLITESAANALELKFERANTSICGVNGESRVIKNKVSVVVSNNENQFKKLMEFLVVPKITGFTPANKLNLNGIKIPDSINLSDKNFNLPGKIEMLIGNEFFFEILKCEKIKLAEGNLILQNTVFGYTASGVMKHNQGSNNSYCGLVIKDLDELNHSIKRFWEIENFPDSEVQAMSVEEKLCEDHFIHTHKRDEFGRFIVQMPLAKSPSCLGDSKQIALLRLDSLWKGLVKNREKMHLYKKFMAEYLAMGHMEEVLEGEEPGITYYLPHHGVHLPESKTTPLRVVFNASSPTSTGEFLNSLQMNGGVIQEDLFTILLRFRIHRYAITADIKKMFRMISIDESQRDLLRIVWKNEIDDCARTYRLTTVTYGTTSAPFLATRSLKQLALDDGEKFPLASNVLSTDVYMDDLLTGSNCLNTGRELQQQLISILQGAGMELHKWSASHPLLLPNEINQVKDLSFSTLCETKALGLLWRPQLDAFSFKVSHKDINGDGRVITKKHVLSSIARIFDPLGLIGPVITKAKMFMQDLWQLKVDWDEPLPSNLITDWKSFIAALSSINYLNIPRYCLLENCTRTELHGFSDSSEKAYGAVLYLRSITSEGQISVKLLCSKSKVAPLKSVTIPRLELCGAVLLSKLLKKTTKALKIHVDDTYLWTDSEIVLAWITKPLNELKTFVRNRVSIIQELTQAKAWQHVSSKNNPADLISRGVEPNSIQNCDLWWSGPSFLQQEKMLTSSNITPVESEDLYRRELKEDVTDAVCALVQTVEPLDVVVTCSSFIKIQRVMAWCRRFIGNARNPLHRITGTLTTNELQESLLCIAKNIQRTSFVNEIQCLERGTPISNNSKLLNLCPFLDNNGVLRVGGRLRNSNLPIDQRHPIIIPSNHNFTVALINYYHVLYFHSGAEATLAIIRLKFWITNARNVVRKILRECITCRKVSATGSQQLMADLPTSRVTPCRVFSRVGVDYCGPFHLKTFPGKCRQVKRVYICIFVCFAVKAVHLEIVSDLTTEAFLGALKGFIARRGRPGEIYSDNGTNFVGANNELRKIIKSVFKTTSREELENYLANEGVKWNFNPPSAPHFGGLWEAGVKSLKYHLKRVVGNTIVSHEEFFTLIVQIEAVLNSRPLCPLSSDPNDLTAITPAHFLIGSSLAAMPEPNYTETPLNRLNRWQLIQKMAQHFWKKWSSEYLSRLQQRPKWHKGAVRVRKGDLVLVKPSGHSYAQRWTLSRVVNIHPGKDNIIRVVTLRDNSGTYKRPVTKICALPFVN